MLPVEDSVIHGYESTLMKQKIDISKFADYKKWLRYFLDFQAKYPLSDSKTGQVQRFREKLRNYPPKEGCGVAIPPYMVLLS